MKNKILIALAATVLLYLSGSFIAMEFNAYYWSIEGRIMYIMITVIASAAIFTFPKT
tara:strand:+ start:53 stop:223 length:171 start_codon:yes stop_codon:yes gene_type:complete